MSPRQMDQDEEPTSPLPDEEQQNQRHGSGSVFSQATTKNKLVSIDALSLNRPGSQNNKNDYF